MGLRAEAVPQLLPHPVDAPLGDAEVAGELGDLDSNQD